MTISLILFYSPTIIFDKNWHFTWITVQYQDWILVRFTIKGVTWTTERAFILKESSVWKITSSETYLTWTLREFYFKTIDTWVFALVVIFTVYDTLPQVNTLICLAGLEVILISQSVSALPQSRRQFVSEQDKVQSMYSLSHCPSHLFPRSSSLKKRSKINQSLDNRYLRTGLRVAQV